ncbi:MAG: hypothetical protein J7M05_13780 [Anaerolineae bacterium]|nr:hypothetical protein [Anaerolineae bacterium]
MHKIKILALAVLIGLLAFSFSVSAESVNVVKNGSFEEEFINGVGKYWHAFNNGGYASYGYHDDTWSKTVYDGQHSQLIEIHTKAVGGSQPDRYTGIYQVVDVVPGARYMFSFYGMVRSTEGSEEKSKWNYRVQVGFDYNGGTDPWAVTEWVEMPWPEYPRLSPGVFQAYAHGITPTTDKLTIFIRVWKKFPTVGHEADINIDAVSLVGPNPAQAQPAAETTQPAEETPKESGMPKTGAHSALPFVGLGLALVAITLTSLRLIRQER